MIEYSLSTPLVYDVDQPHPLLPGTSSSAAERRLSRRAKTSVRKNVLCMYVCVYVAMYVMCMYVLLALQSALELQPLVEAEEGEGWGGKEEEETDVWPLRAPTMVVGDTELPVRTSSHLPPHHSLDTWPEAVTTIGERERVSTGGIEGGSSGDRERSNSGGRERASSGQRVSFRPTPQFQEEDFNVSWSSVLELH